MTNVVVTELITSSTQNNVLTIDSAHHCSPKPSKGIVSKFSTLSASAGPIHLTKGKYTIVADRGGFDAGDGKVYFKAELRFIVIDNVSNTKIIHINKVGQHALLNVYGTGGGYLFGLVRDQSCGDNQGTLVLKIVKEELVDDAKKNRKQKKKTKKRKKQHHVKMIEV